MILAAAPAYSVAAMSLFNRSNVTWTPEAEKRLARVPVFVRPFVRRRAEAVARERGLSEITPELLAELKEKEMPK
jgi:hypothetical protein